jgi:hypothetical protein
LIAGLTECLLKPQNLFWLVVATLPQSGINPHNMWSVAFSTTHERSSYPLMRRKNFYYYAILKVRSSLGNIVTKNTVKVLQRSKRIGKTDTIFADRQHRNFTARFPAHLQYPDIRSIKTFIRIHYL